MKINYVVGNERETHIKYLLKILLWWFGCGTKIIINYPITCTINNGLPYNNIIYGLVHVQVNCSLK